MIKQFDFDLKKDQIYFYMCEKNGFLKRKFRSILI